MNRGSSCTAASGVEGRQVVDRPSEQRDMLADLGHSIPSLSFQKALNKPEATGLNWRSWMLGSACLPAIFVCAQVHFTPESARWLMTRGRWHDAYASLLRLRRSPIQAAIDLYYTAKCLEVEEEIQNANSKSKIAQLVTVPRNRRACWASSWLMLGQQYCGVNAIAY
ncbi:hypothetical protein JCM10212_002441 [Sporobolomyces blumeae]